MLQHLLGLAAEVDDGIADDLVVEPPVAQGRSIRNRIAEYAVRGALQHVERRHRRRGVTGELRGNSPS